MNATHPTWEHELNAGAVGYLTDHAIHGTVLMPAAGFIEMALAAARQTYGDADLCLTDLQLNRALVLGASSDPRVRTVLNVVDGAVEFSSFLAQPDGERRWTVHASAKISGATASPAHHDLDAIGDSLATHIEHEDFYEITQSLGFDYGPAFQTVHSVAVGADISLARLQIPTSIQPQCTDNIFHPSLIDAALQVLIVAATHMQQGQPAGTYLPVGIDKVTVLGPAQPDMRVVARVVSSNARELVSDLTVCDPDGQALLQLDGFRARSLEAATRHSDDQIAAGLLDLAWKPVDDQPTTAPAEIAADSTWLLFTDRDGVGSAVAAQARTRGARVVEIAYQDGLSETQHPSHDHYVIDPQAPDQYTRVLADLTGERIERIGHLWSLDHPVTVTDSGADLEYAQQLGLSSVTRLMQALSTDRNQLPRLWIVTQNAVSVDDDAPVNVAGAPLWGLGRVIGHQEFTTLWGGLVDLAAGADAEQARMLTDDMCGDGTEDQLAYRGTTRHVARLRPTGPVPAAVPGRVRADATYLITGGLGALGMIVTRSLCEHGARHIVLTGRRSVPEPHLWDTLDVDDALASELSELSRLQAGGVTIDYVQLDVADADAIEAWHGHHRDGGRPTVRGVIHVAGIVDDQLLVNMDLDRFHRVLRPKIAGGWNLHRAFATNDLDFFVLFGSTGSVITTPGQGNYASGNAFLDALSHARRLHGLPATTISWGPWSVGMVEELHLEETFTRRGIELITPEAGGQILHRILGQKVPHLIAITADWAIARETAIGGQLPAMFAELGSTAGTPGSEAVASRAAELLATLSGVDPEQRPAEVAIFLQDVIAHVMSLDAEAIGVNQALSGLGLDSMMSIEIKHRLEAALGVDVSVLDLMQGATLLALAARVVDQLELSPATLADEGTASGDEPVVTAGADDDLEDLLADLSPEELERVLGELELAHLIDTTDLDTPDLDTPALHTPALHTPALDTPALDTTHHHLNSEGALT